MRKTVRTLLCVTAFVATAAAAPVAAGATSDAGPPPSRGAADTARAATASAGPDVAPGAAEAFAAQRGISVPEAARRLREQGPQAERGRSLERSLAGRTGGSYIDDDGQLVVQTLDASGDARVRQAGVRAQRVGHSAAQLDNVVRQLDAAGRDGAGGVQGWYVDVPTNTVVVTVTDGATDPRTRAILTRAAGFGSSVRIERAPADEAPHTTDALRGGLQFFEPDQSHVCSVGFDAVDSLNRNVVVTAGHCVKQSGTISRNGYSVGATRTANFPTDDYGTFWNSYPSYWTPSPSVWKYNNTYVYVRGVTNAPAIGSTVCKSGRTTGYTCGTITALNQTVNYPEGTIYGLVRHTNCVEPGDSGGANISGTAYALGVTSGASTISGQCLSKSGGTNVSWYQPIGEALQANGLRLLVQP